MRERASVSGRYVEGWRSGALVGVLVCLCATAAAGQALMEYGQATASASVKASAADSVEKGITLPSTGKASALPATPEGEAAVAANRQALAAHAGKHAAKLMLRSIPNDAQVRIDGKAVGTTPVLLILAPGVYSVEMEGGARVDSGRQRVGLLPGEAREVVLTLAPRYPAQIRILWPPHQNHEQGSPHGRI